MRRPVILAVLVLGTPAMAQENLPEFARCMDIEAERFEWRLEVHRERPLDAPDFQLWNVLGVEYCSNIAITLCDRSEAPIACQQALTQQQEALHAQVLEHLPAPETVEAEAGNLPMRLYARTFELAHGTSAGPDCEGAEDPIKTWCEAREASNGLQNAVLAWQVARYLNVAEPAVTAGWAQQVPTVRPRARPSETAGD